MTTQHSTYQTNEGRKKGRTEGRKGREVRMMGRRKEGRQGRKEGRMMERRKEGRRGKVKKGMKTKESNERKEDEGR